MTLQIATCSRLGERVVDDDGVSLPESLVSQLGAVAGQPPAADAEIKHAEALLGIELPTPLRDLYLRVGNGGFGPGYGVLGLDGGFRDDLGKTALDTYRVFMLPDPDAPAGSGPFWRESLLPLCYWGCVVYTAVDCRTSDARVVGFDEGTWIEDGRPLAQWLKDWLADPQMPQPLP